MVRSTHKNSPLTIRLSHCYSSTISNCTFVDEVTDISRFPVWVKSPESASHPNLNVMFC